MYDGLYHSGVPGQKWGVRHGPPYPISRTSEGKPRGIVSTNKKQMTSATKSQYKSSPESARKGVQNAKRIKRAIRVSSLSDDELKARIARLQLEKQYKELVRGPQTAKQVSEGKKVLYKTLSTIGTTAATSAINGLITIGTSYLSSAPKKARDSYAQQIIDAKKQASLKSDKQLERLVKQQAQKNYIATEAKRRNDERMEREEIARNARAAARARAVIEPMLNTPRLYSTIPDSRPTAPDVIYGTGYVR